MANGRNPRRPGRKDDKRVPGGFVALPHVVLDSPNFRHLNNFAVRLLLEIARQYKPGRNGCLLASRAFLEKRGIASADMIHRAKNELLAGGFIFETVKGRRPNRASWYALTWYDLDPHRDYDAGTAQAFQRGAFYFDRAAEFEHLKIKRLSPVVGTSNAAIAPIVGTEKRAPVPIVGTIHLPKRHLAVPIGGHQSRNAISDAVGEAGKVN